MSYLFIMSLPRSGSTWLQRELVKQVDCITYPETWIFLPLVYGYYKDTGYDEYSRYICSKALRHFFDDDDKKKRLSKAARQFFDSIFHDNESLIIEKTPRNSLIFDELLTIFPDEKFIVLLRDPVDIAVSILSTWGGRWNTLFRYEIDFVLGLNNLLRVLEKEHSNVYLIKYEDISNQDKISELCTKLNLPKMYSEERSKMTEGLMGDKKYISGKFGNERYKLSFLKKRQIKRLISKVDADLLRKYGWCSEELFTKLDNWPVSYNFFGDLISEFVGFLYSKIHMVSVLEKIMRRNKDRGKALSGVE